MSVQPTGVKFGKNKPDHASAPLNGNPIGENRAVLECGTSAQRGDAEDLGGQFADAGEQGATAREMHTSVEGIEPHAAALDVELHKAKSPAHAASNDRVESFAFDFAGDGTRTGIYHEALTRRRLAQPDTALLDEQLFPARIWEAQLAGELMPDLLAAKHDAAALPERAAGIDGVIGGASAHVDDERAELFLLRIEHGFRARHRSVNEGFDRDAECPDKVDAVFDARAGTLQNVPVFGRRAVRAADAAQPAIATVGVADVLRIL